MQNLVAFPTKRDQVGLGIVTMGTASYLVVNIKFSKPPHFWQRQPSRSKISLRSLAYTLGAFGVRGLLVEVELFMSLAPCRSWLLRGCG